MSLAITLTILVVWYASNIGLLLLNKVLLSNYDFKYPIFLTALHMLACSVMSYAAVGSRLFVRQPVQSRQQLTKIATVATVFCGSLVLANTSLRFIPVSFNQAVGSTTPAFTALLSILMTSKYESRGVYLSLVPVVLGIAIASGFEPSFHMFGFLCCMLATAMRAFKSVLQGILLSDPSEKMDSMNLLLYMAPIATISLLPLMLAIEDNPLSKAYILGRQDPRFMGMLLLNAFLAYFVNLANFLVTRYTSALTLQVLGNAKGVLAAALSVAVFRNKLTAMGVFGYSITVLGVFAYSEVKRWQKKATTQPKADVEALDPEKQPFLVEGKENGQLIKAGRIIKPSE